MLKLEHLVFSLDFQTGNFGEREGVRVRLGGALKLINIFNVFGTLHVPSFSILHSVQFCPGPALPSPGTTLGHGPGPWRQFYIVY